MTIEARYVRIQVPPKKEAGWRKEVIIVAKPPWFYKKQQIMQALKELGNAGFDLSPKNAYRITQELHARGFDVAYRTVRRYLEELQAPATPAEHPAPAVPEADKSVFAGADLLKTPSLVLVIVLSDTEAEAA